MDATDGVPIPAGEFRSLVAGYLDRAADCELTVEDCITMARLWNTIESAQLAGDDELYRRYHSVFFPSRIDRVAKCLNALPTKGMALYSKEHDLYIGGPPHPRSRYSVR